MDDRNQSPQSNDQNDPFKTFLSSRLTSDGDQLGAYLEMFASAIGQYARELMREGFTREETLAIILSLQMTIFNVKRS